MRASESPSARLEAPERRDNALTRKSASSQKASTSLTYRGCGGGDRDDVATVSQIILIRDALAQITCPYKRLASANANSLIPKHSSAAPRSKSGQTCRTRGAHVNHSENNPLRITYRTVDMVVDTVAPRRGESAISLRGPILIKV